MNRGEMNALISRHDCFCSIAVMAVKIPDTNPFSDVFQVLTRMRTQQFMICRSARLLPSPVTVPLLQYRRGASNALRTLWMPCLGIVEAAWIVKNSHRACKVAMQRIFDDHAARQPEDCGGDARV